ncbi:hypothetical protein AMJ39_02490 [candidate division TA06 bacterium DG_24]|uniref:histidine kinase n=2 Tax=Bacteria division TA06 TaxID=1156500 RepID=A0A0S8GE33_UNCT6|nr:MAG: hypothetical protein AMJ39_02490 [candidate division TA06 bacterium DG_24]KPK69898.1 MAG: hypothetical protein AMJ82_04345 [candidate division TA06 bacterium SM23_40]
MRRDSPLTGRETAGRIAWLLAGRPLVVSVILGTGIIILNLGETPVSLLPLYLLIGASCALSIGSWLALLMGVSALGTLYVQLVADIVLETGIIHFTGGPESSFSLLYFLTIICGSIVFSVRGGLVMACLSGLAYGLLLWGERSGVMPFAAGLTALDMPGAHIFLRAYLHVLFFFLVAALSGYLSERLRVSGVELKQIVRELHEARLTTDDILQNMGSGLVTVDLDGKIVYFNRNAELLLECAGRLHHDEVLGAELPERVAPFRDHLMSVVRDGTEEVRAEVDIQTEGGSTRSLGLSTTVLYDREGRRHGAMAVFRDITQVKEIEERLRLADRMAALGELAAGIAHEIRNPMGSIRGCIEMLADDLQLRGEHKRLMELIIKESDRLNDTIDNFLRFARSTPPAFYDVDISGVVDDAIRLAEAHPAYRNEIRVECAVSSRPIHLEADPERVRQALFNLLLNAFRAIKGSGTVRIEVSVSPDESALVIACEDDGVGISPEEHPRIFEPFYSGSGEGTGLGLAIVHRIVEEHGGTISVESKPNEYTRFVLALPLTRREAFAQIGDSES